jgi:hypothetical protein
MCARFAVALRAAALATACGDDSPTCGAALTCDDDHYHDLLTAAGWTTVGPVSPAGCPDAGPGCATEQLFTMGGPLVLVHVDPTRRGFSLGLRNLDD